MTTYQLQLIREADQILAKAGLNKIGQKPKAKGKFEDVMAKAIRTPCGGQPGFRRN